MTSQAAGNLRTRLAENIQRARATRGLTQRQLAEALDVDPMLVSKWERAAHRPNDANLFALAARLEREVSWFYEDHAPEDVAA